MTSLLDRLIAASGGTVLTPPEDTHPIILAVEPCPTCPDDPHFGSTDTSVTTAAWDGAASRFTDEQYQRAAAACDPGDSPPKTRCFLPHHEPGGATNANGVHAAAQRVSSLKGHDPAAVSRAKAHLRAHYAQMKEQPPDSLTADGALALTDEEHALAHEEMAAHGPVNGEHSHPHAAMGAQGGDETHSHTHAHDGDASHDHPHETMAVASPIPGFTRQAAQSFVRIGAHTDDDGPIVAAALVASHLIEFGSPLGIASDNVDDGPWQVLTAAGEGWTVDTYADAIRKVAEQMAAQGAQPMLDQRWRSVMAYEGVSTGDGRKIAEGAIQFRPTPLPVMLQTVTGGGHMGAVLAGSADEVGKVGNKAVGAGSFYDFEAGRQFVQIIAGQGKFGVSIDVGDSDGEIVCNATDNEGECTDREVLFTLCEVMGFTGTPFPAFQDAYIEFDDSPVAAQPVAAGAGLVETSASVAGDLNWWSVWVNRDSTGTATITTTITPAEHEAEPVVAAGGPALAPSWAFDDPKLDKPTRLRVERIDGGLTRIYGHLATWDRCHTGYADRCVRPPRSPSGYAFFNDGPLPTSDGQIVHVGQITMGCGHADTNPRLPVNAVKAHYDGGPGAVVVADVHVGEDRVGIWYSGVVRPDVTDDQLRHFQATKRSGDWRNVERGKGIDLVAILGDVPVPGFPVHEPLAASAAPEDATVARYDCGVLRVLVASFTVDEPEPWQVALDERDEIIADLRDRLAAVERIAAPLMPLAASALIDATLAEVD